ncbi:hypothetical protein ACF09Y_19465 [Streptomyces massasporeus]|uniref:hypothetical protein n=1 Tax=Streptomyces massasporeus TaxID=67324 RepID=UPI0036F91D2B
MGQGQAQWTLDRYPAGLRHRDAVVMLRTCLSGLRGESDQRLGRSAAARRGWNAMLADDPLPPAVLRNLAVAHTTAGDLGQAAHAWRRQAGRPADERERPVLTAAVTALERWVERLPGATGPARTLAVVLSALDRHDEARQVLARALREAFGARGRRQVALSQIRLDITGGRFTEAVHRVRELLLDEPDDESLRRLLIEAYDSWITSGRTFPRRRTSPRNSGGGRMPTPCGTVARWS